ncbi:hypothetical protein [Streptomyces humi]
MRWETRWQTGEGLLGLDDPAEWDAAFERGEDHLGTAAIGLALNCPLEQASCRARPARPSGFTSNGRSL